MILINSTETFVDVRASFTSNPSTTLTVVVFKNNY